MAAGNCRHLNGWNNYASCLQAFLRCEQRWRNTDETERDVDGANLDRLQIIKGWLGSKGKTHEQVFDVMCSDGRKITDKHRCDKAVGNTVDVKKATYTNSIGDALMLAYWKDPSFDQKQRAFYYIRVREIPPPRWTAYDAKYFKLKMPPEVPMTTQERAYTSPIWYTP